MVVTNGAVKTCKARHIITNKLTSNFVQAGSPSCHQTNSVKALKGKGIHIPWICSPKLTWGSSNLVFDH